MFQRSLFAAELDYKKQRMNLLPFVFLKASVFSDM